VLASLVSICPSCCLEKGLNFSTDVNKVLYGALVLLLHHFKLERAALDDEAKAKVFPPIRADREMSMDVDAIADQVAECDSQAIPLMAGVKLTPRNPDALTRWIAEAPTFLDQFEEPDLSIKAAGEA
jgi:hypothetical protein